jgi:hypothetical protein
LFLSAEEARKENESKWQYRYTSLYMQSLGLLGIGSGFAALASCFDLANSLANPMHMAVIMSMPIARLRSFKRFRMNRNVVSFNMTSLLWFFACATFWATEALSLVLALTNRHMHSIGHHLAIYVMPFFVCLIWIAGMRGHYPVKKPFQKKVLLETKT